MRHPHIHQPHRNRWSARLAAAAAVAATTAAIVQNRSRKAERDHPPNGAFVEVEGVRLHYVGRGRGEPLVLLHGNTTMGLSFLLSDLVEMAAQKYRVIIFDRPGYGHSGRPRDGTIWGPQAQARLIHDALATISVERPIVFGHSWGALVAMALALDHPRSVGSLVLESGYYYPTARPDVPMGALPAIPVLGDALRYTVSPLLLRAAWPLMVKRLFAPAAVPPQFWRFPAWMTLRPFQMRTNAAEIAMIAPAAAALSERYRDLSVPLVIVAGSEDRLVNTSAHSERLHADLPQSDFRQIEGMGHMLYHLVPDQVMTAIDAAAWLRQAVASDAPHSTG